MLPSRGLRPASQAQLAARRTNLTSFNGLRKFSSLPRIAQSSILQSRTQSLHSTLPRPRNSYTHAPITFSSVRHGSWYAPWSWGKSSAPTTDGLEASPTSSSPASTSITENTILSDPVVTSATPEIAPAGIDKAATVNTDAPANTQYVTVSDSEKTLDDVLNAEPIKDALPIDPTRLIDHPGQLQELGLDYGWGMTTMVEKLIESLYLNTGWGWAGSIVLGAFCVRGFLFPFQAMSSHKMAALAALKPLTQPIQEKMEAAIARGDKQQVAVYKLQQAQIIRPHMNSVVSMGGLMLLQMYVGFSAFRFLRAAASMPVPGLSSEHVLWLTDLTLNDPYFILPLTTASFFWIQMKLGGETGVGNDAGGDSSSRKTIQYLMPVMFATFTAFQAAALQVYFLAFSVSSFTSGWLLRQNWFRRFIRIRLLPTPQSNDLFAKVARGEIKLSEVRGPDGKITYRAPTSGKATQSAIPGATRLAGINIKSTTAIPAHLKVPTRAIDPDRPDRDIDYDIGPQGGIMSRVSYYRRNYKPTFVWRRMQDGIENTIRKQGYGEPKSANAEVARRRKRAEDYEAEKRRRFENRK